MLEKVSRFFAPGGRRAEGGPAWATGEAAGSGAAGATRKVRAPVGESAEPSPTSKMLPPYAISLIDREPQKKKIYSALGRPPSIANIRGRRRVFILYGRRDDEPHLLMPWLERELGNQGGFKVGSDLPREDTPEQEVQARKLQIAGNSLYAPGGFAIVPWFFSAEKWQSKAPYVARLIELLLSEPADPQAPAVFVLILSGRPRADDQCLVRKFVDAIAAKYGNSDDIVFVPPPDEIETEHIYDWVELMKRMRTVLTETQFEKLRAEGFDVIQGDGVPLKRVSEALLPMLAGYLPGSDSPGPTR